MIEYKQILSTFHKNRQTQNHTSHILTNASGAAHISHSHKRIWRSTVYQVILEYYYHYYHHYYYYYDYFEKKSLGLKQVSHTPFLTSQEEAYMKKPHKKKPT